MSIMLGILMICCLTLPILLIGAVKHKFFVTVLILCVYIGIIALITGVLVLTPADTLINIITEMIGE